MEIYPTPCGHPQNVGPRGEHLVRPATPDFLKFLVSGHPPCRKCVEGENAEMHSLGPPKSQGVHQGDFHCAPNAWRAKTLKCTPWDHENHKGSIRVISTALQEIAGGATRFLAEARE